MSRLGFGLGMDCCTGRAYSAESWNSIVSRWDVSIVTMTRRLIRRSQYRVGQPVGLLTRTQLSLMVPKTIINTELHC